MLDVRRLRVLREGARPSRLGVPPLGREARAQILKAEGKLPAAIIACVVRMVPRVPCPEAYRFSSVSVTAKRESKCTRKMLVGFCP